MGGATKELEGPVSCTGIKGGPGIGPLTAGGLPGGNTEEEGLSCGAGLGPLIVDCSQVSSTGGGTGVETVLVLMSPIMCKASFRAWYILSMSSLRCAWSADSSIKLFWSAEEYR